MSVMLENENPVVFQRSGARLWTAADEDEGVHDPIDHRENILCLWKNSMWWSKSESRWDFLKHRSIDPHILQVNDEDSTVGIEFTPTIPHCSMATLIGLSIKVKLLRSLPERFKIDVHITPGTHASEDAVNKQLADKERVAAALENSQLLEVVNQCLSTKSP
ncbi:unnamed protein product [Boreogadus saida]